MQLFLIFLIVATFIESFIFWNRKKKRTRQKGKVRIKQTSIRLLIFLGLTMKYLLRGYSQVLTHNCLGPVWVGARPLEHILYHSLIEYTQLGFATLNTMLVEANVWIFGTYQVERPKLINKFSKVLFLQPFFTFVY